MFVPEILSQQFMQYYAMLIPHANMEHGVLMQAQTQAPTLAQSEASMGTFVQRCVSKGGSPSQEQILQFLCKRLLLELIDFERPTFSQKKHRYQVVILNTIVLRVLLVPC